ncbi:murein L,D-transpeptidase [Pseudomonas sp. 5P_3.1_Bac2]|uniref:L,D-transpeptidase family protein n=1 Tax=Pseudomonas sp. 5P_3.1_Bac2 TaxID=2971617 RepID=UPI0021C7DB89|nr:L,D-transpeptidase family protein [Pseudomonas sp. 5P_3.1_Bac2]MCU1718503.1 L,D-transpeptidase family protein [Pseudomonas sp. 5P_3.1_Bac2]
MLKKTAYYLSLAALLAPLVANAEQPVQSSANELSSLLHDLSPCGKLPASLDQAAQSRLQQFYGQQQNQPAWSTPARLQELHEQIAQLADDGLSPSEYPLPALQGDTGNNSNTACADILTSHSFLQALQHLQGGRLHPKAAERLWRAPDLPASDSQAASLAVAIAHLEQPSAAFAAARPQSLQYQQLRQAYAQQRQHSLAQWQALASGQLLKPNGQDLRLPQLRTRLSAEGYLTLPANNADSSYDPATQQALQDFQRDHGLNPDGVLGPASLTELNISPAVRREQLRANLERLRWLGNDLNHAEVLINVAAAELQVWQQQQLRWSTRVQVGRAERATPLLISQINRLTLNPTWTVPPTIWREDKLPAIRQDLGYLDKHQLSVIDHDGNVLDPLTIDWQNPGAVMLRQAAGKANPLGRMAVRFANPFAVYLHDTPSQHLFSKAPRAFSAGCVRVEAVDSLLDWLLSADEATAVRERIATGETQQYRLKQPKTLLMAYWTAAANADGKLQYYPDIYRQDQPLIQALPH